jgi:hypothetical protein
MGQIQRPVATMSGPARAAAFVGSAVLHSTSELLFKSIGVSSKLQYHLDKWIWSRSQIYC